MTDLERLARAIAPRVFDDFNPKIHGSPPNRLAAQRMHLDNARAVLTALREPSERMLDAGWEGLHEGHVPRAVWQEMIDAVLSNAE